MAKNACIIYYSQSGTTEHLAKLIQIITGAHQIEIEALHPYSKDYEKMLKEVADEKEAGVDREYCPVDLDVSEFDVFFIGTPNWGGSVASPLATFLKDHDFSGKKIIPFLTHGGAGEQDIEESIAALCPQAQMSPSYISFGKVEQDELESLQEWIHTNAQEIF
ncbi:flavodoxin family protein [Floccifex sp.]|uniref:flavodoxin family protein n=1 Tax=Floccifex sp. TaxID=2815810 RepID=UPI003F0D6CFB